MPGAQPDEMSQRGERVSSSLLMAVAGVGARTTSFPPTETTIVSSSPTWSRTNASCGSRSLARAATVDSSIAQLTVSSSPGPRRSAARRLSQYAMSITMLGGRSTSEYPGVAGARSPNQYLLSRDESPTSQRRRASG